MDRLAAMDAFIPVVDAGSFSGAAKQLRMGQPAVSKAIVQLEERLSVRLLLRTARQLTPTEAGWNFYERTSISTVLTPIRVWRSPAVRRTCLT